jgi:hypothetical protein
MKQSIGLWCILGIAATVCLNGESHLEASELLLKETKVGEADGVLSKIKGWYGASDQTVFKTADTDLNGDGKKEVVVEMRTPSCMRKTSQKCDMFLMYRDKYGSWSSLTASPRAHKVFLLQTATKGWRDLKFDDTLYTYSANPLPAYHASDTPGERFSSTDELGKQRISYFGLSMKIGSDWKSWGHQTQFKSHQRGYANYEGRLPGASKNVYLSIEVTPKKTVEEAFRDHSTDSVKTTMITKGKIGGHPVTVYYLDINHGQAGSIYLAFEDEVYFSDPKDPNAEFFPMHLYVSLSGKLLYGIDKDTLQNVLDTYITPFINQIHVTEKNTFATDTTQEQTPLVLRITDKKSTHAADIQKENLPPKSSLPLLLEWKEFRIENPEGEWTNTLKSDTAHLVLQSRSSSPKEIMIFVPEVAETEKGQIEKIIRENVAKLKNSPLFTNVIYRQDTQKIILGKKVEGMIVSDYKDKMKVFIFFPYIDGKLHMLMFFTSVQKSEDISPKMQRLLKGMSMQSNSMKSVDPFKRLTFSVNIDYTPQALQTLKKVGEKVEIDAIIDQYGKSYMEEEAVAYETKIVSPGEKVIFHGVSVSDDSYHFQKGKRYIVTVMVSSARKAVLDNLLACEDLSGNIDYAMETLEGKELQFKCRIIHK